MKAEKLQINLLVFQDLVEAIERIWQNFLIAKTRSILGYNLNFSLNLIKIFEWNYLCVSLCKLNSHYHL